MMKRKVRVILCEVAERVEEPGLLNVRYVGIGEQIFTSPEGSGQMIPGRGQEITHDKKRYVVVDVIEPAQSPENEKRVWLIVDSWKGAGYHLRVSRE